MADPVIEVHGLRKSYGGREAVRGISLAVERGEVFAFLGPNGAGKTTTVEILEGYRRRSAGEVSVLGIDPGQPTREWRERIGIVPQSGTLEPELTVRETVARFAGYYPHPRPVDDTVAVVGLAEQRDARVGALSGGQHRRLDVGLALVGDPELLFLDEPTTGFDPSARRTAWGVVGELRALGKTVFLTTHYMDEAQALADRVAIIAAGEVVAEGTPDDIGGRGAAETVIRFRAPATPPEEVGATADGHGRWVASTADAVRALHALTSWALDSRTPVTDLTVQRPSLEDVYLALTETR